MEKCRPSSGRHPQSHTTTPASGGWSQKRKPRVPDRFAGGTMWLWTKTIPLGRAPPVSSRFPGGLMVFDVVAVAISLARGEVQAFHVVESRREASDLWW